MEDCILKIINLTKKHKYKPIVDSANMNIKRCYIYGFIGENDEERLL